jgi:competence protein ComEA
MKYVWAGLAIVAAVAALFFRPPNGDRGSARSPIGGSVVDTGSASFGLAGAGRDGTTIVPPSGADAPLPSGAAPARARGGLRPSTARIVVYVAGEVNKPGVYAFASGARAQEALTRAGGAKPDADLVAVNLAARLDDGAEVAVPKIGAAVTRGRRASGPRVRASHQPRRHGRRRNGPADDLPVRSVDLNAADVSQLEMVPGIGPALATRIVEFRETNGPFTSVDELADVSGITPRLQETLADFVVIR